MKKALIGTLILLSLVGFIDALYLSAHSFKSDLTIPCIIFDGCDLVTRSEYSTIMGIPVALLGAIYYALIFLLLLYYAEKKNPLVIRFLPVISFTAFVFSVWFTYVQIFLLSSICTFCLISALCSTAIFILAYITEKRFRLQ